MRGQNMINKLIQLSKIFKEGFTVKVKNGIITQYNNANKPYVLSYKTLIEIHPIINGIKYINANIPNKCIIGGWLDTDTNTYYIALNKTYKNKSYTLKIAKKYDQKAIYNSNTGEVIYV